MRRATADGAPAQPFDFSFEEEDGVDGMKRLIVDEVNSFRAEVRAHARGGGQVRRQDRCVPSSPYPSAPSLACFDHTFSPAVHSSHAPERENALTPPPSLPIPTRDEIIASPVGDFAPANGATSAFGAPSGQARESSPVMEDPSAQLERELAGSVAR